MFNQIKNIALSYFVALRVIDGDLTLGAMVSISYIVGQLNSPFEQLLVFIKTLQDARISTDRLMEIHHQKDEEKPDDIGPENGFLLRGNIVLKDVSFSYDGANSLLILNKINICIPEGKVTAIVGSSGCGKTTLMKLLLKFYEPTGGNISINDTTLPDISAEWLRSQCGVVMQDGKIFSETIERNISVREDAETTRLNRAINIANLEDFITSLPLGVSTKIGNTGMGISAGQKQRILISRAIYKDPQYIFFDEATSALDAKNERIIIDNLNSFFKGRTVVVIAHRLSTVRNADQIIVMQNGSVVESGTHLALTKQRGVYYDLVKNQLELGNE